MRKIIAGLAIAAGVAVSAPQAFANTYLIDTQGAHASINFKVKHLGFSWLTGRFDDFNGNFTFDKADPTASKVEVVIDTESVNSNHAERDKHLRSPDFLDVSNHPEARFVSTGIEVTDDGTGIIKGDLTLRGVTKPIEIQAKYVGGGEDPWGGNRQGFMGTTTIALADFGIPFDLGPASREVELTLHIEGIRQ